MWWKMLLIKEKKKQLQEEQQQIINIYFLSGSIVQFFLPTWKNASEYKVKYNAVTAGKFVTPAGRWFCKWSIDEIPFAKKTYNSPF